MARRSTTWLQTSTHRFLVRRMEHALLRGEVRMVDDPPRAQSLSLIAGCVLAVITLAACAVLALMHPRNVLGNAPIVMVRESGALYVRIGDVVHPVANLTSARLIAGSPAEPEMVSMAAIERSRLGPMVGIPGAPSTVARRMDQDNSDWTICDDAQSSTAVVTGGVGGRLDSGANVLVVARGESAASTYLLYGGRRARVDLRDPAVVRALRIDGVVPRPVSRALLDAIPEAPPIAPPHIAGAGAPSATPGLAVASVIRVMRADSVEYFVVLAGGVQRIGQVAADLIRFTSAPGRSELVTVSPDSIGKSAIVDDLPVTTFPQRGGAPSRPVLCARWRWSTASGSAETEVLSGDALPIDGAEPRTLAQADGVGPAVDSVVLPPGRVAYVRASGVTGAGSDTGALFLVDDSGALFGVRDDDTARRIGLSSAPTPAPWPVLAWLPRGPELSVQAASVERDSAAPA
jgi:type VII secretion protein EccB